MKNEFDKYLDSLLIKNEDDLDEDERLILEHFIEAETGQMHIVKKTRKEKKERIAELLVEVEKQEKFLNENISTFRPDFNFENELEKYDKIERELYKLGVIL